MKILFLSDNFPPEVNASASRVFERACYWVKGEHHVTVLTCAPNFPQGKVYEGYKNCWVQKEQKEGIDVIRVKTFMAPNKGFTLRILDFLSYMMMAVFVGAFQKKPDVVVATSPQFFAALGGWMLSRIKRVPFIFELSDLWPESIQGLGVMGDSWTYQALEKLELFLYRQSKLIIAQTSAFKANLVARGIDPEKIKVILNGVDISRYQPITHKDKDLVDLHHLEDKFIVGYIGTHGMAQDLKRIMEVAKRVMCQSDKILFLFVGDGAEREETIQYTHMHGITNVLFVPQQPKEEIQKWWSLCDVALVPLKDVAIFKTVVPSKIFEAAALNLPVLLVAPPGEASQLVVQEKIGVYVPAHDLERVAQQILDFAAHPSYQTHWAFAPRIAAQKHSREAQAHAFLKAISEICPEPSAPAPIDITIETVKNNQARYVLVDIREPYELIGPEGRIETAILATLGPQLTHFLETADPESIYVFICRRGTRSAHATKLARSYGLSAYNMEGGMISWNQHELKIA